MKILIKNILLDGQTTDVLIEDNRFALIQKDICVAADVEIDGTNKAILPAFYNQHTHAAMNLLRGLGDDKELFSWLNEDIWPREATFDDEIIYWGTKFAILEMIKTGTVGFSDMYFEQEAIMKAAAEMGVRAMVSFVEMDLFDNAQTQQKIKDTQKFLELKNPAPELIRKAIAVHAVYTASEDIIRFAVKTAHENNLPLHIHACETQKEVDDCKAQHGCSPIVYLNKLGALSPNTILAHAVHLDDEDIKIIKENNVILCHNPVSNMKLCSGAFAFDKLTQNGCFITLGTDGSASNNNLNMFEEMKIAALSAKLQSMKPTAGKAQDIFKIATFNGAKAMGIDAGVIQAGKLADCLLIDLNNLSLIPNYNLISNIVYAANPSVLDTVICNGRILMKNGVVPQEEEIKKHIQKIAQKLS